MKRLRIIFTLFAFVCALAAAAASNVFQEDYAAYGKSNYTLLCTGVYAHQILDSGCGPVGLRQCKVYLMDEDEGIEEVVKGYSIYVSGYVCAGPLLRW